MVFLKIILQLEKLLLLTPPQYPGLTHETSEKVEW